MFWQRVVLLLLLACCLSISATKIIIIKDARLVPSNTTVVLNALFNITSQYECVCQCLSASQCRTVTYYGYNNTCSLFSTSVKQTWLRRMSSNQSTNVISLDNGTLSSCTTYDFQQPPSLFVTNAGPTAMVSSDFNRDGHIDLAVTNTDAQSVSVFVGLGDGSFDANVLTFPTNGSNPYWLTAGDFNSDGHIDLANCNEGSNTISILFGYDNSSLFSAPTTFLSGGTLPSSIINVDLNNDMKSDLVVTNTGSDKITVFLSNGNGTFQFPGLSMTTLTLPSSVASGDFNYDGKMDLAVASRGTSQLYILFGLGNGTFQSNMSIYSTGSTPYLVRAGDFNGDAVFDVVVGNFYSNSVNVFINNGSGAFNTMYTYTT
ncbi:unnamed protein product, partial [Adineta ricciae]